MASFQICIEIKKSISGIKLEKLSNFPSSKFAFSKSKFISLSCQTKGLFIEFGKKLLYQS
jgi:hypothetical protein